MSRQGDALAGLLAVALLSACAHQNATLGGARKLLDEGKLVEACDQAEALTARGPRHERLGAYRLWVNCLARRGRLAEAQARLSRQAAAGKASGAHADGGVLYGRSLATLAASPAKLPQVIALLAQAERAWPAQAEIPYRAGLILLTDAQAAAARAALERACKLAPTAHCSAALAHALLDLGHTQKALAEVRKILARHPTARDIARGRQLLRRAVKREQRIPPSAQPLFDKAEVALLKSDRAPTAINQLRELLVDHPDLPAAHTLLGLAHLRLDNTSRAVVAFERAAKLSKLDARNHYFLGVIYRSRLQSGRAIDCFRRALELDPFLWRATAQLGRLLGTRGKHREAARLLDRLVLLAPTHVALRLAGREHLKAGTLERAERHYRALLAREPRDFEGHLRLAQILLQLADKGAADKRDERRKEAREHAAEAAAMRPTHGEVRSLLGQLERH